MTTEDNKTNAAHKPLWYLILAWASALLILALILVTCIDVFGRYLLNQPLTGAYELTQMFLATLVFVALPLTSRDGGHVEVDLALHLFPKSVQLFLGRLAGMISAVVLLYFGWRLVLTGIDQIDVGAHSAALGLPMAPLAFLGAACCVISALAMIIRRKTS